MAKFRMISALLLVVVMMEHSAPTAFADIFRSGSVNLYNEIDAGETVYVDCMKGSGHRHILTPTVTLLASGEHLGWNFTPDFSGMIKFDCDITWQTHFRRVRVWEDTYWIRVNHIRKLDIAPTVSGMRRGRPSGARPPNSKKKSRLFGQVDGLPGHDADMNGLINLCTMFSSTVMLGAGIDLPWTEGP